VPERIQRWLGKEPTTSTIVAVFPGERKEGFQVEGQAGGRVVLPP
jgi:hypothetical protein